LPQKGCQEIEGICYDPQIPQMAQITISSRGLCGLRDLLILRITHYGTPLKVNSRASVS
jgi:hypothetical protein